MHSALLNTYLHYISPNDQTPGLVDEAEARSLIDIAIDINAQGSGCCSKASTKGDKDLALLVRAHGDHFEPAGRDLIQTYLETHNPPIEGVGLSPVGPGTPPAFFIRE